MTEQAPELPATASAYPGPLSENACKARYGLAYVRSICSQSGIMMGETSPDEDALAIDCNLTLHFGMVLLQVKCSSQFSLRGRTASWPMELHWKNSWTQMKLPVYFVLVVLDDDDRAVWLDHQSGGTFHRAAAYWRRVDIDNEVNRISVDKNQRLTTDTFHTWNSDLLACFTSTSIPIQNAG